MCLSFLCCEAERSRDGFTLLFPGCCTTYLVFEHSKENLLLCCNTGGIYSTVILLHYLTLYRCFTRDATKKLHLMRRPVYCRIKEGLCLASLNLLSSHPFTQDKPKCGWLCHFWLRLAFFASRALFVFSPRSDWGVTITKTCWVQEFTAKCFHFSFAPLCRPCCELWMTSVILRGKTHSFPII